MIIEMIDEKIEELAKESAYSMEKIAQHKTAIFNYEQNMKDNQIKIKILQEERNRFLEIRSSNG